MGIFLNMNYKKKQFAHYIYTMQIAPILEVETSKILGIPLAAVYFYVKAILY